MQHLREVYGDWVGVVGMGYLRPPNGCRCVADPSDWTLETFFKFPQKHGFQITEEYELLAESGTEPRCAKLECPAFLQAWLFFTLIYCVLQNDERPFLKHTDLIRNHQLTTTELPKALNNWYSYMEKLHNSKPGVIPGKILKIIKILEFARRVVRRNLAEASPVMLVPQQGINRYLPPNADDERRLCIMVLGETLSAALVRLVKTWKLRFTGWEWDDGGGWGPPTYVSKSMSNEGWCPRAQAVVKGQLGQNATLLYITFLAHRVNPQNCHKDSRRDCTPSSCKFIEAEYGQSQQDATEERTYSPSHSSNCNGDCTMEGPEEEDVLEVLDRDDNAITGAFPLMRIHRNQETGELRVTVEASGEGIPFAAISHVWSQGLGNRTNGMIRTCQLQAIHDLVSKVFGGEGSHLFWFDTFAIPKSRRDDRRKRLKQKAIGLIHHVFNSANHCLIIDRYMTTRGRMSHGGRTIAAMLLASGWMARLWTLQEAFVSRQLHIALGDQQDHHQEPPNLDTVWSNDAVTDVLAASVTDMMKRQVYQNILRKDTKQVLREKSIIERALLVGSVWKAVRYRTTRKLHEETLALSTLLGIPIPQEGNEVSSPPTQEDRERLMEKFWGALARDETLARSIPPGIIFLPGNKLSSQGFRWAPSTWMSGQVEPYPFPLENPRYPTELSDRGLVVHYPGFILYPDGDQLSDIISSLSTRSSFNLCVSRGLDDWYSVLAARRRGQYDDIASPGSEDGGPVYNQIVSNLMKRSESNLRIGIIISRPRPVAERGEIGILVEIYDEGDYHFKGDHVGGQGSILYCRIIRHVEVTRLPKGPAQDALHGPGHQHGPERNPMLSRYANLEKRNVYGVQLDETQTWCVDGFDVIPLPAETSPPPSQPTPSQPSLVSNFRQRYPGGRTT